jgi:methionyl-tRNA formyltransferase
MEREMDAGPVFARAEVPIAPDATTRTLEPELAALGASTLVGALPAWLSGERKALPQDDARVTLCSLLRKEDGHLAATISAAEAERAVRAYDPWPGAYVLYRGQRLAIWRSHVSDHPAGVPGALTAIERAPAVAFAGGWLVLDELQRVGARRVDGAAFLNGERGQLDATVGLA